LEKAGCKMAPWYKDNVYDWEIGVIPENSLLYPSIGEPQFEDHIAQFNDEIKIDANHSDYKILRATQKEYLEGYSIEELTVLKPMINSTYDLFHKYRMDYFAYHSTMLGYCNHRALTPWEDIVEFVVEEKQRERIKKLPWKDYNLKVASHMILEIEGKITKLKIFHQDSPNIPNTYWGFPYIEISTYHTAKDKNNNSVVVFSEEETVLRDDVFPTKFVEFDGMKMQMPARVSKIVKEKYGSERSVCAASRHRHRTETTMPKDKRTLCSRIRPLFPQLIWTTC